MAMMTTCVQGDGKHRLETRYYDRPYTCHGCKEPGFGLRYRCDQCSHEFHEACTLIDSTKSIWHDFFPYSKFQFQLTPVSHKVTCDACTRNVKGFVFRCAEHNLDLHPCCRELARRYQIKGMMYNLSKEGKGKCIRCKHRYGSKKKGWWYVSACGKNRVHVDCVTLMTLEEWNNNNNNDRMIISDKASKTRRVTKFVLKAAASSVIGEPFSSIIKALF